MTSKDVKIKSIVNYKRDGKIREAKKEIGSQRYLTLGIILFFTLKMIDNIKRVKI